MKYQSYKNRTIDFNKKVKIYKNLHNGLFSVMQNSLVVAHVESFLLNNVVFKVNESGRQRVIKEKKKNVHAFITGILKSVNEEHALIFKGQLSPITYNPYKASNFYFRDDVDCSEVLLHDFELVQGHCKNGLFLIN